MVDAEATKVYFSVFFRLTEEDIVHTLKKSPIAVFFEEMMKKIRLWMIRIAEGEIFV